MIFHLGFELPKKNDRCLNAHSAELTSQEVRILKEQIRKNSRLIDDYIRRLDLFVNKERYPKGACFLGKIRRRLLLLMEENDTFRRVLWQHCQRQDFSRGIS